MAREITDADDNSSRANDLPTISVVLPIRNEAEFIARTIGYIQTQDYPPDCLEILVVVGDSKDKTMEIVSSLAREDSRIRVLHNPGQWSSCARNIGARAAAGDIVTYIDGHTYIDNTHLLTSISEIMKEKDVRVLSRPQFLDTPDQSDFQRAISTARSSVIGHGLDSTIYSDKDAFVSPASSGATYARQIFEDVGYFDEGFDACEDFDFNYRVYRAGYRSFTSMRLAVYYYPRKSYFGLFKQMMRYGTGRMRLARKHPGTLSVGTLLPPMFVVGLIALPLLALMDVVPWEIPGLIFGLYAILVLLFTLKGFFNGPINLMYLPFVYFGIHTGLGVGFLGELWRTVTGKGYRPRESRGINT